MSLSLLFLPGNYPVLEKVNEVYFTAKQEIDNGNLKIIMIDDGELESTSIIENKDINIFSKGNISLDDITTDFVMFIDKETSFSKNFFQVVISEIDSEGNFDFFQLVRKESNNIVQKSIDVIHADYEDISSMKILNKRIFNMVSFFSLENISGSMITELYFELFKCGFNFKTINNIYIKESFNQSIETIIADGELLTKFILTDNLVEQKKALILFKKAFVTKLFNMIDTRNFVDLLPFDKQELILQILKELMINADDLLLEKWGLSRYIPAAQMVREGFFTEAIYYIRLMRGKRYWYQTTKDLEGKIKQYPIEDSLSWKITAPLRNSTSWRENIKGFFVKMGLYILSVPAKLRFIGNEVWLISERADQAEDNGYYFFKYCRENYPNKKIFYVINSDSPHVEKIERLGNVIYHSSLKHWIYLLVAKKYVCAWVFEETSFPRGKINFKNLFRKLIDKKQQITLQHGVIMSNIAPYLNKDIYNQKLFIASANDEKEIIKTTLGYEEGDVVVTGLSRFDNLHNSKVKRQILIMPTWRRSLFRVNQSEFFMSQYYKNYYDLVRNKQLLKLIEQEDIEVKFYVHSQMQQFMSHFAYEHPRIQFLTKQNAIVAELLKESALLITDYSSVVADFLYMEKPILLYQFDPHNNHSGPVTQISFSEVGEIVTEEIELIGKIDEYVKRNFKIKDRYLQKSNTFFAYKDNKNSERIFHAIENLTRR